MIPLTVSITECYTVLFSANKCYSVLGSVSECYLVLSGVCFEIFLALFKINRRMKKFPFITLAQSLIVLRVATAGMFLAHAVVRMCNDTIPRFAGYMENKGFPFGMLIVILITIFETIGGILMLLGYYSRWMAAGFIFLLLMGNGIIHWENGWFVGEHGSGGMEYSFELIFALIVIAAADKEKQLGK
jgi:putative oxidoreductase